MAKKKIEEIVTGFAAPIVDKNSFELVDVEFIKEGSNYFLRIYIDKPGGITIDDCKIVSEEISDVLDKEDPIVQKYFLEVSSPGLDRPLKKDSDFERFKGEMVEIKVFKPIDDKKVFEGKLLGYNSTMILIEKGNGEKMEFERDKIALVRRLIKF
jgi:ribosome maturation factor RimP